jgi:hypothetical protein
MNVNALDREASMDDQFPFGGPKGAGVGAHGRGLSPLDPLTYFGSIGMAFAHAFAGSFGLRMTQGDGVFFVWVTHQFNTTTSMG